MFAPTLSLKDRPLITDARGFGIVSHVSSVHYRTTDYRGRLLLPDCRAMYGGDIYPYGIVQHDCRARAIQEVHLPMLRFFALRHGEHIANIKLDAAIAMALFEEEGHTCLEWLRKTMHVNRFCATGTTFHYLGQSFYLAFYHSTTGDGYEPNMEWQRELVCADRSQFAPPLVGAYILLR